MLKKDRLALHRLVAAIDLEDPDRSDALLASSWAVAGTLSIDGELVATTRAGLADVIADWQDDPRRWVELRRARGTGSREWGRWKVGGPGLRATTYLLAARLDEDGRIEELDVRRAEDGARRLRQGISSVILSNPYAAAALFGTALYLALRLPAGLFYGRFGISPDEVGIGPEVLVPQSLMLMVAFLAAAALMVLVLTASFPTIMLVVATDAFARRTGRQRVRRVVHGTLIIVALAGLAGSLQAANLILRHGTPVDPVLLPGIVFLAALLTVGVARIAGSVITWIVPEIAASMDDLRFVTGQRRAPEHLLPAFALTALLYGVTLLVMLPFFAWSDAARVQDGGVASGRMAPWRALPVTLRWKTPAHVRLTDDCRVLRLLGTGNGELMVYDTKLDKLFRVPIADASASVDRDCA